MAPSHQRFEGGSNREQGWIAKVEQRSEFFQVVVNRSAGQQHLASAGEARTEQHVHAQDVTKYQSEKIVRAYKKESAFFSLCASSTTRQDHCVCCESTCGSRT